MATFNWNDPEVRKAHRSDLIRSWFKDIRQTDGPGMVLMVWETLMPVEERWETVLDMVRLAHDDSYLGHIGAGPLESLLGSHGAEVIDRVESTSQTDPRFLKALRGVWKFTMERDANYFPSLFPERRLSLDPAHS